MHGLSKKLAITLIAVLMLSILSPIFVVKASTGHPKLAAVDSRTAPTTLTPVNYNISIAAGTDTVSKIDNAATTGYFAIVFYDTNWLVTFSGSQFDLYISKDG
ncbi:MAG: hypothetical protein QXL10_05595, partial [Candidatus Bathyarchaeia archaeon]